MPMLRTRIVGQAHRQGAQTRLNELRSGHRLELRRERTNKFDRAAVAVWDPATNFQLGYVPRDSNRNLAIAMDAGIAVGATIEGYQPNILIVYPVFPQPTTSADSEEDLEDWLK